MPNWCSNRVTISGPTKKLKALLQAAEPEGKPGTFSLEEIYPVPKPLSAVVAGSDEMYHDAVYGDWRMVAKYPFVRGRYKEIGTREELIRAMEELNPDKDIRGIARAYEHNLVEYGARTWWDWCVRNWGTKWNFEAEAALQGNEILMGFDTAWSPPIEAFCHLSERYPELEFFLEFFEEGMGFIGTATLKEGDVVSMDEGNCQSPEDLERFDFAPEIYDWVDGEE